MTRNKERGEEKEKKYVLFLKFLLTKKNFLGAKPFFFFFSKIICLSLNREKLLFHVVLHHLTDKLLSDIGVSIFEASGLDCRTVNGEGVVVEKFRVEVGGERSAGDTGSLAHLTPWLKVLVVDILDDALEVDTGSIADEGAIEASGDAEDGLEDLVDLLLVCIVLISKVVKSTSRDIDSAVPHGGGDITHVNGADAEITRPHELHLLLEVLVDSSADDTRSNAADVTRTVNGRGTKNDERKARHCLKVSLSLKVSLGKHGPWVSLITLLGRLLASSIDLSSAEVYELLDWVLNSLLGDLHANVMKLLLIDRFILTILGLCSAVEDVVEFLALLGSEALCNGTSVGEVTLDKLHDGVREESAVGRVKEGGLREHLIDAADFSSNARPHEILAKITADEASATKNKNGCHLFCYVCIKTTKRTV